MKLNQKLRSYLVKVWGLLIHPYHIHIPFRADVTLLVMMISIFSFMWLKHNSDMKAEWASPSRSPMTRIEVMKTIFLLNQELDLAHNFFSIYKESTSLSHGLLPEETPSEAARLNDLANIYVIQGDYDHAMPLFDRAKQLVIKYLGKEHGDVAVIDDNIRHMYGKQQRMKLPKS